jgi:hypothetical protein
MSLHLGHTGDEFTHGHGIKGQVGLAEPLLLTQPLGAFTYCLEQGLAGSRPRVRQ